MALVDFHDLDELKNKNEEKVWKALEKVLGEHEEYCKCRDCVMDAAAIALNNLPAKYQVYSFHSNEEIEGSPNAVVEKAVLEALGHVTKKPHHF